MEALMNLITGHDEDQQQMETDDGQGKRFITRDEWIKTLPDTWRNSAYAQNETKLKEHIAYFEHLLKGYEINLGRLELFAGDDEKNKQHSKARFISDMNDDEYDTILLGMGHTEVRFTMRTLDDLRRHLEKLIQKCVVKKQVAINMCENIAEIEGKPKWVGLKAWQFLPVDAREFLRLQEREIEDKNQHIPKGLLNLLESLCNLKEENNALRRDVESLCKKNMKIEMDKGHLQEKLELQDEQQRIYSAQAKTRDSKQSQILVQQISGLREEVAKRHQREAALIEEKRQLQKEKESLLTRLSEVAGAKLTQNNPAITDLSDENRPIKLSEKFSQMYDDEWTDSLEEIVSSGIDEVTSIRLLLQIVMRAFRLCKDTQLLLRLPECKEVIWCVESDQPKCKLSIELDAKDKEDLQRCTKGYKRKWHNLFIEANQKKFLSEVINMIEQSQQSCNTSENHEVKQEQNHQDPNSEQTPQTDVYTGNFSKAIYKKTPSDSENRDDPVSPKRQKTSLTRSLSPTTVTQKENPKKRLSQSASADFAKPDHQKPILDKKSFTKVLNFAEHCIELCWWMQSVQPPVHLDCIIPKDGKMSHELYKAYTKSGKTIDYIVWPVMFLHENGPLLSKGVAQPQ